MQKDVEQDDVVVKTSQNSQELPNLQENHERDIEWKESHPLNHLSEQIEAKRVTLTNPSTGEEYDFGACFHGYGRGVVNGANLRFDRKVFEEGVSHTLLNFRVNRFYLSGLQQRLAELQKSPERLQALSESLRHKIKTPTNDGGRVRIALNKDELRSMLINDDINPGSLGNVVAFLKDVMTIRLTGDRDIDSFRAVLSAFKSEEVIQPSTSDDLERLKLGFIFKFFYPSQIREIQEDGSFFTLSIDELKQKMLSMAPAMENYWKQYTVKPVEILPGYVRYSIPADQAVYDLGGRALTAMIVDEGDEDGEIPSHLNEDILNRISNIVQNGMLSKRLREIAGFHEEGLGARSGDRYVYTQMIWKEEVESDKKIEKLGYSRYGDIRLYFSLKALNQGSYQYNRDLGGTIKGPVYENRKNIFDFMRYFPFWKKEALKWHEIMVPSLISPQDIQGMSVPSETMREQLIDYFREHGVVQKDENGHETLNGIPLKEFISIEHTIPSNIMARCGRVEEPVMVS